MKILLKNAKVFDGTASAPKQQDVLIQDDRIVDVAPQIVCEAQQEIDCDGLCIAPGFIDAHSHNDWFTIREDKQRFFDSFIAQGITTQVTGNCGFSPFGYQQDTEHQPLIGSGLFSQGNITQDISTLDAYIQASGKIPVNIAPLVGHMSSRISLAGYENRPLTADEIKLQDQLLERELEAGALGISLGLMYEPDRYAPYEELKRAAQLAKKHDKILTVHARACSSVSTSYGLPFGGRAHNLRALDEMLTLARETGVKLQYSHLIFVGQKSWKTADESLRLIEEINKEGGSVFFDSYSMLYGASVITVVLPSWYLSMPKEKRKQGWVRARLAVEIGISKMLLGFTFEDIQITWAGENLQDIAGMNVHEIARKWKMSDIDAYIRLVDETDGTARVLMYKYLTDEILAKLMQDKRCLYMTDAWIEEEGIQNPSAFQCFPQFLALARQRESLAHTIRQMTGATADRFGLVDRGYLRKHAYADLVIFDESKVAPSADPNGAPMGIDRVMINGQWAVVDGKVHDAIQSGRFLLSRQ